MYSNIDTSYHEPWYSGAISMWIVVSFHTYPILLLTHRVTNHSTHEEWVCEYLCYSIHLDSIIDTPYHEPQFPCVISIWVVVSFHTHLILLLTHCVTNHSTHEEWVCEYLCYSIHLDSIIDTPYHEPQFPCVISIWVVVSFHTHLILLLTHRVTNHSTHEEWVCEYLCYSIHTLL